MLAKLRAPASPPLDAPRPGRQMMSHDHLALPASLLASSDSGVSVRIRDDAALAFLGARRSVPSRLLVAPGPDDAQLGELLRLAVRVPDHGKLEPWRFVRIGREWRTAIGERLVTLQRERNPGVEAATLEKDRLRFATAPLVLAVIARITPSHKIPEQEQLLSGAALCFNLLLVAQAQGFGAQWLTGWPAYDPDFARDFALAANERFLGFIHVGTAPADEPPERPRPDPETLLSDFEGPPS